jgi:hypothetical protein
MTKTAPISRRQRSHHSIAEGLADTAPTGETLLTLAGYNVGQEFRFAGVRAVWMASQGQLKFDGDDGAVLRVVDLGEPQQAKAA